MSDTKGGEFPNTLQKKLTEDLQTDLERLEINASLDQGIGNESETRRMSRRDRQRAMFKEFFITAMKDGISPSEVLPKKKSLRGCFASCPGYEDLEGCTRENETQKVA